MNLYISNLKKGLKRAREEAGLTQDELAEKMGVSTKTIRNWEQKVKANTLPTMENLLKLADLYDCDLDYLTGRIECKTHDLQFIHDQTGLSEKAIKTLQWYVTEPDWEQMEQDLRESCPEIPEDKIHEAVQRRHEQHSSSMTRHFPRIISIFLEDVTAGYLLSLIARRVVGYKPRQAGKQPTYKELTQDDLYIDLDGQRVLTKKRNMLDSLIQSEISNMIPYIAEVYHSTNSEQ